MRCLVAGCLFDTVTVVNNAYATVADRIALIALHERATHPPLAVPQQ